MKNKEYQKLLKNMIFGPIIKITEVKGHDYACDADTLRSEEHTSELQSH